MAWNIMTPVEPRTIFIGFLQGCITPVAMLSGVGIFTLTVTNRMARTVDRTRQLVADLNRVFTEGKKEQVRIFVRRSQLLRNSIACIVVGMISSCMMIPLLFIMSFTSLNLNMFGYIFFLIAVISMLLAFVFFFRDVLMSLQAIKLEAKDYL